ncbi:MAG: prepilin-type N-terminal cleavage/methylation domain-containing protein [Nitrospirae bacterium]|nr:prepilin-type N-terminal cleavage/methylation domain-containing protein [Nitrospirota bacterium]
MKNERGVTLIEMIFSIILIGVIGIVASNVFLFSTKSVLTGNNVREATQVNRLAMDRMIREIRNVRDNKCVQTAAAADFKFVDGQNNTVEFSWAGAGAPLLRNTTDTLVGNVSSLAFTYYNNADPPVNITALPPTVCATPCAASCTATNIWSINIDLTTQSGTETMQLRSQVHPRSF